MRNRVLHMPNDFAAVEREMNLSSKDVAAAERFLFALAMSSENVSRADGRIQVPRGPRKSTA